MLRLYTGAGRRQLAGVIVQPGTAVSEVIGGRTLSVAALSVTHYRYSFRVGNLRALKALGYSLVEQRVGAHTTYYHTYSEASQNGEPRTQGEVNRSGTETGIGQRCDVDFSQRRSG